MITKVIKYSLLAAFLMLFVFVLIHLEWVTYGLMQGKGQWNLIRNAKPVSSILADAAYPDSLKQKLKLLQEVKQLAHTSLGMADSDIYNAVFEQEGKPVMFVVSACASFQLLPHEWEIPLAGNFPYKGFFNEEKARKEADKLRKNGLDVSIRTTDGWSTLGFIDNPLLSNNLMREEGDLIELIVHEIAHETIFFKSNVDFNENLATFIGIAGTEHILKSAFPNHPEWLERYRLSIEKENAFVEHMVRGAGKLDSLYTYFSEESDLIKSSKADEKEELIHQIVSELDTLQLHRKSAEIFGDQLPNNAYFMSFLRYRSMQPQFYDTLKNRFNNSLPDYIEYLKSK